MDDNDIRRPTAEDLRECDREPIHLANAIQPHGALLAVAEPGLEILQASANVAEFLGEPAATLIGRPLRSVLGEADTALLEGQLAAKTLCGTRAHLFTAPSRAPRSRPLHVFGNRIDGVLLLELEAAAEPSGSAGFDVYAEIREAMQELQRAPSLPAFFAVAVNRIRDLSGFERVMAYRFAADGSGEVIAEAKSPELEPYLGLHFPASDIPDPARRLFALSWLRHLPDVDYAPVPMVPERLEALGRPLDLSHALLRSVSLLYVEYLRNMGTRATLVMPLMKAGRLWGLISCMHHSAPRYLPYERRLPIEVLGHLLSLKMGNREDLDSLDYKTRLQQAVNGLVGGLGQNAGLHEALAEGEPNLLSVIDADGAALLAEGKIALLGATPGEEDCRRLAEWLAEQEEAVFSSDRLAEDYPPAAGFAAAASGVLSIRLSRTASEVALWFRREVLQEVSWAGDPRKPVEVDRESGHSRLRPRASFALWKETARGRSRPWLDCEVDYAVGLRRSLLDVLVDRSRLLARINAELERSNRELDAFAHAASHDLREPLRAIHNFVELLSIEEGERLTEQGRLRIQTIIRQSGRMESLLQSLLHFSRVGRIDLELQDHPVADIVAQSLETVRNAFAGQAIRIEVQPGLPVVRCDRTQAAEIFHNLFVNAVKYNDQAIKEIHVGCDTGQDPPVFFVRDNGIGIAPQHHERIFQLFRRLHGPADYGGGTGSGLTIAKKAVERHGGRIWVASEEGRGSTFHFTLAAAAETPESGR